MSRTQAHGFRIGKVFVIRRGKVLWSYWIEQFVCDDWLVIEKCDDWHDAITKLEKWQNLEGVK